MAINDPTSQYAQALRKRQEATQARAAGQRFRGLAESAPSSGVVGGGPVGDQQAPAMVDWGSIIQRGVGNYQAAKGESQANKLDAEAQELNQQFMISTLGGDEEAQRLMQMAQAGVPGAEEALAQKISPKREALAGLLQGISSGQMTPELGAEIAPKYGLDPQLVASAIQAQQDRTMQSQQTEFDQKMQLRNTPQARAPGAGPAPSGKLTFEQYQALTPEGKEEYDRFTGRDNGRGATTGGLTPGQLQIRDRAVLELDKDLQKADLQMAKYQNMRPKLEEAFGGSQKVAEVLTGLADLPLVGPLAGVAGSMITNEANTMLKDYVNSEVLTRMAGLGGNDSNEELRRMSASLPNASMDPRVALALADALDRYNTINRVVKQLYRDDVVKFGAAVPEADRQYYKIAEQQLMQSGQIGPPVNLDGPPGKRNLPNAQQLQQAPQARGQMPDPGSQPMPAPEQAPVQPGPMSGPLAEPFTTPSGIKIRIKQ